jgi:predicted nucleic acid-binding protein
LILDTCALVAGAATARASDRVVVTTDVRARFDELPGVAVHLV